MAVRGDPRRPPVRLAEGATKSVELSIHAPRAKKTTERRRGRWVRAIVPTKRVRRAEWEALGEGCS